MAATPMPGKPAVDLMRVTEQCASGCADNGGIPNLTYRSPNFGHELAGLVQLARVGCRMCGGKHR